MFKKIVCTLTGILLVYASVAFAIKAAIGVLPVDAAIATIADVILDGQAQAQAAGYFIDQAYVSWAELAQIRGLKDANGNYLYDQVRGILGGVRIIPSTKLSTNEMMLVDSGAVRIKERPTYEVEVSRNAQLDGWDIYLRKSLQNLVKSADKAGVIYVADVTTAITAINEVTAAVEGE